jgi:hypothetical protein
MKKELKVCVSKDQNIVKYEGVDCYFIENCDDDCNFCAFENILCCVDIIPCRPHKRKDGKDGYFYNKDSKDSKFIERG